MTFFDFCVIMLSEGGTNTFQNITEMKEGEASPHDKNYGKECVVMNRILLASAKAMAEAFNQEWIINIRRIILQSCRDMIPLLENR